jgi:hypothetical protein
MGIATAAVALGSVACSSGGTTPAATSATATLAAIDAAHVCAVTTQAFRTEDAIDADLLARLRQHGLDRAAWRQWHDSLVESPARAAQVARLAARPCP